MVKLHSCSNYIAISGGVSEFWYQIYEVLAQLWA